MSRCCSSGGGIRVSLIFGPARAAVAKAVVDSVAEGIIPKPEANSLLIIASIFIEQGEVDKKKIYD